MMKSDGMPRDSRLLTALLMRDTKINIRRARRQEDDGDDVERARRLRDCLLPLFDIAQS